MRPGAFKLWVTWIKRVQPHHGGGGARGGGGAAVGEPQRGELDHEAVVVAVRGGALGGGGDAVLARAAL